MNLAFYFFIAIIALLFLLFLWSQRKRREDAAGPALPAIAQDFQGTSISNLPQVRQALAQEDYEFLEREGGQGLRKRVRRERQRVALKYLWALKRDFDGLLRIAKIIAVLSPEIGVGQEFERLRLTLQFLWRFRVVQLALYAGYAPVPQVAQLSGVISGLSIRLDSAIKKMGERAALVAEMASPADRGRVGLA